VREHDRPNINAAPRLGFPFLCTNFVYTFDYPSTHKLQKEGIRV
jgi:hypothetical protein